MKKNVLLTTLFIILLQMGVSAQIVFQNIPNSIRKPGAYIEYNINLANHGLLQNNQSLLVIGTGDTSRTCTDGVPYQIFDTYTLGSVFGTTSNVYSMGVAALNANAYCNLYALSWGVNTIMAVNYATDTNNLQTALNNIFGARYNIIAIGCNSTGHLQLLKTMIEAVGGPLEQRGEIGIFAFCTTNGTSFTVQNTMNATTTAAAALNSGRMLGICYPNPNANDANVAAAFGSVVQWSQDPARPLNYLVLNGITPPSVQYYLSRTQQEALLNAGVTPLMVGPGSSTQIVRAISTFMNLASGVQSIALLEINTIRTLDFVRDNLLARYQSVFPRSKLNQRTIDSVRAQTIDVLILLEQPGVEDVQNVEDNESAVLVQRNIADPTRLDIAIPTTVVSPLNILAGQLILSLN